MDLEIISFEKNTSQHNQNLATTLTNHSRRCAYSIQSFSGFSLLEFDCFEIMAQRDIFWTLGHKITRHNLQGSISMGYRLFRSFFGTTPQV